MDDFEIDDRELEQFNRNLESFQVKFPIESRKMLRLVGNQARKIVLNKAKQLIKKDSGNYFKSIKRGKVFFDREGKLTVRVYSNKIAPHAHLIEFGHRIVGKDGTEHGFQPGYHVFEKATPEVETQFNTIVAAEFEKMLEKL